MRLLPITGAAWHWIRCLSLAGWFLMLAGCSLLMPREIVEMESRTQAQAASLLQRQPEAEGHYTVQGQVMHFVQVGANMQAPLVIFIHGSPGDWRGWSDYLIDPELSARARLIAVDRPGFGASGQGQVERSLSRQSADLAPLLDKARPGQRIVLVGHSFGGPLAVRLAMDHPDKITDLILLAGSIDPNQEVTEWYQIAADWPPLTWVLPSDLLVTNREIMALKAELSNMLPLWPRLHQRVTVIQGGRDNLVPPANADFAQRMLTNTADIEIVRLPDVNHFLPWNQYALVKKEILRHLE